MSQKIHWGGLKVLRVLALGVMAVFIALLIFEATLRLFIFRVPILSLAVDIQTPTTLYAKLEEVRRFKGLKVIVFGDSLVFGRTMREHGDGEWQSYTLAKQIENHLSPKYSKCGLMVSNLGMNGVLPADLNNLVRIVSALKPDLAVFDLSLRSFSRDFAGDDESQTRKWLADMNISHNGRYDTNHVFFSPTQSVQDLAINYSYLYRHRDFFQALLFDGDPSFFVTAIRNKLNNWLRGEAAQKESQSNGLGKALLLMKARSRYSKIDLEPDNPQVQALVQTLARLKALQQPAIAFYATEKPQEISQLLDPEKYASLLNQLAKIIAPFTSESLVYVAPLSSYQSEYFLDHVHLNREGYRYLSGELAQRSEKILNRSAKVEKDCVDLFL